MHSSFILFAMNCGYFTQSPFAHSYDFVVNRPFGYSWSVPALKSVHVT